MSAKVWRHPKAQEDLLDIWLFIAREDVSAADRLLEAIEEKCRLLADYPEIGAGRPEIGPGVRVIIVGNYIVLHRLSAGRVEIVRVVHGARQLADLIPPEDESSGSS